MDSDSLDDVDRGIIHLLQMDARNNTTAEIAERVDVSATTVSNRIKQLESDDVIDGYHPEINYEKANLPLHILFVCTAPVAEQDALATKALDVFGVIDVQEMLRGTRNVHVEAISRNMTEIEETTESLDDIGLEIETSEIVKRQRSHPFDHFGSDRVDD